MAGRLEGKVAVITGGASGIGAATAELFVAEGARVLIGDLQTDVGEEAAAAFGDRGAFQRCNVAIEADVAGLVAGAVDRWGRLDCIYNNAGFGGAIGPIASTTEEDFDLTFDVLLKGVFFGMKHAAPVMAAQGSGSIISTASVAGLNTGGAPHLYNTAKAGVIQLTRSVANEMAEHGVRVNCICPGFIATPLAAGKPISFQGREAAEARIQRMRDTTDDAQPMKRFQASWAKYPEVRSSGSGSPATPRAMALARSSSCSNRFAPTPATTILRNRDGSSMASASVVRAPSEKPMMSTGSSGSCSATAASSRS